MVYESMSMEDSAERDPSEAQNGLDREEMQSVQGYVAIKGTRNGLLLTLEPGTPFGELLNALAARLAEAPSFFQGASLAVDTSRRMLHGSERVQLEALLAHYQMSVMPLEQVVVGYKELGKVSTSPLKSLSSLTSLTSSLPATDPSSEKMQAQQNLREIADTLF